MKTIAFYIRNTVQYNNYIKPYSDVLLKQGHKVIILHTNSLTKDLSKDNNEVSIENYDIGNNSIKTSIQYLKNKNIDTVVSINFHSPMDLLVNRLLNYVGVKSIYMEHGILADEAGRYIKPTKPMNNAVRLLRYLKKYFIFSLVSKNTFGEITLFYKAFIKKQYKLAPYNHYLLFSKRSYEILSKTHNLNNKNVSYSGYPINTTTNRVPEYKQPYLLYIHQPYISYRLSGCTYEDEFNYLKKLSDIANNAGCRFILKLHPVENKNKYKKGLSGSHVFINTKESLVDLTAHSKAVLGHYSTALFVAIKFKKPLIQVKPRCFNYNINFDLFKDVALQIFDENNLTEILQNENKLYSKIDLYDLYLKNIIGTNNNYKHRVETLLNILNDA